MLVVVGGGGGRVGHTAVALLVVERARRGVWRNEWYAGENVVHVAGADGIG